MKSTVFAILAFAGGIAPCAHAQVDTASLPTQADDTTTVIEWTDSGALAAGGAVEGSVATAGDAVSQCIDILIVYTPAARAYAGSAAAMRAAINGYVATTNQAYQNSDIHVTLRLVGAVEVSYVESDSFQTDLSRLTSSSDSYIANVHALRNTYGADLVCLIRRNGAAGVAGLAYIGNGASNFSPYAFSVVGDIWAVGNLSFPHELGHNFGCQHNRSNANTTPVRTYAYGHKFTGNNNVLYCTVMSYQPGTRIPYFSNPDITYQGQPTGVASGATAADNARMIEEMAVPTATFRNAGIRLNSMLAGDIDNDGTPDMLLSDRSTGERTAWLMSDATRSSIVSLGTLGTEWRLAAVADLNADEKNDILWENTATGARAVWYMDGTTRSSVAVFTTLDRAWRLVAAADMNGDDKPDLIWENTSTGARALWYMNGVTTTSATVFATLDRVWRVGAVGDFDADGKNDLVWENTSTGAHAIWFMNGATRLSVASLPTLPITWRMAGAGDANGDGKPDLFWENASTGQRAVWHQNNVTTASSTLLTAAPQ